MPSGIAFRRPTINGWVVAITLMVIILSQLSYQWLASVQYLLLVIGTLIIGIPHGATDDHIFRETGLASKLQTSKVAFYGSYILIAVFYAGLWFIWPAGSFTFFLLISIYHFGQSQMFYLNSKAFWTFKLPFYLVWGSYVLFLPIMFSYPEAKPIITELLGYKPMGAKPVTSNALTVALMLMGVNLVFLVIAELRQMLTRQQFIQELVNLGVLGLLAYTTPLFVAFITYWALWHSFNSMIEISTFLTKQAGNLNVKGFYKRALPLSLITFSGIAFVFWLSKSFGSTESMVAIFFIIIAAITLPHSVLMDVLYKQKQAQG
jgi:Brp/Blh family beta-carotene 15,15'-monooxygenase